MTVKYYLQKQIEENLHTAAFNTECAKTYSGLAMRNTCRELAIEANALVLAYDNILHRLPQSALDAEILTEPEKELC